MDDKCRDLAAARKQSKAYYEKNKCAIRWRHKRYYGRKTKATNLAKNRPCMDCGGKFPYYVMQFDHRPGEVKLGSIAVMTRRKGTLEELSAEIAKCDVVCANCHYVRGYGRGGNGMANPEYAPRDH